MDAPNYTRAGTSAIKHRVVNMANIFESGAVQDGQRATESTHRKIELQSPADLTYLIANVTQAAREKLDKHLPPDAVAGGDDAMRKRVEQLVNEVGK